MFNEEMPITLGDANRDEMFEPTQYVIPSVKGELKAQDNIVKNSISDQTDNEFNKLLYYYRQRIDVFEDERIEWLQKIEEIKVNLSEKHSLNAQLKDLKIVIGNIQAQISDSKAAAFTERISFLNLQRLNADLRIKDIHNRKKIAELTTLSQPKTNPSRTIQSGKSLRSNDRRDLENDLNFNNIAHQDKRFVSNINENDRISLTTIYFPNENLNGITLENESLKAQQLQERELFQLQFDQFQRDLKVRNEELRLKEEADRDVLYNLEAKVGDLQKKHYALNKLFFETRRKCKESESKLHDEKSFLNQRAAQLANKLEYSEKHSEMESEALRSLESKKTQEYTNQFQVKMKSRTQKIEIMKEQYAQIQNMYQQKTRELELTHSNLLQKYNNLQADFEEEKQGYGIQIEELQAELSHLQEEQRERGLVPEKRQPVSHEDKLMEEKYRVQEALRQEKLERNRLKEKIYNETTSVPPKSQQYVQRYKPKVQPKQLNRSSTALSEIDEVKPHVMKGSKSKRASGI